jgi:hypothetical protein
MKWTARSTAALATAYIAVSGSWAATGSAREPELRESPAHMIAAPARIVGEANGVPLYTRELTSKVFRIDRIMKSMLGPDEVAKVTLWKETSDPELLWITGYRAVMTGPDAATPISPEFMCHSNLILSDGDAYHERFPSRLRIVANRLFSLDQGSLTAVFPVGTGVPIMSDQLVLFNSQVLNHNVVGKTIDVRQKVYVDFVRDADLPTPLTPLVQHGSMALVLIEGRDGHYGMSSEDVERIEHGPGCSLGDDVGHPKGIFEDTQGRRFSAFWVVPPGRQENHTRVTPRLTLPYDTTLHFATAHLHPFAESLELRDVTVNETVFIAKAKQATGGIGLASVTQFSSAEGVPIYRDHEYDLISIYNNTSDVDQDAMATMLLYLRATDLYDFDFRPRKK